MNWEPGRADHSIDRATASVTFLEPLDANTLDDLIVAGRGIASANSLKNRVDQIEPLEIAAGAEQLIELRGSRSVNRLVLFQRLDAEGIAVDEISMASRRVAVGTLRYSRWVDLYRLVQELLHALNHAVQILGNLRTVRLEFVDRFESTPGGADHFEVVSRDSRFLPPVLGKMGAALHAHCGWFDFETPAIRQLTNVNIDVSDVTIPPPPDARRKVSILTMAQYEALEGAVDRPVERLDVLHGYLKSIFADIITSEAAARVALKI